MKNRDMYQELGITDKKWQKLLKRAWLFRLIPFVDFVFVAGSMAMGRADENSDFDLIVGCRQGRIFTARFSCWVVFNLFGLWARHPAGADNESNKTNMTNKTYKSYLSYKDKFCFSHFVTPSAYRLSPPYDNYCQILFSSLVPIYGNREEIQKFFDANTSWMNSGRMYKSDTRHVNKEKLKIIKMKEWLLNGYFGDLLEKFLKKIQIKKIEQGLAGVPKYNPRIIFNDNELEFHPSTKRIEDFCK